MGISGQALAAEMESFVARTPGMTLSRIGRDCGGDPGLHARLLHAQRGPRAAPVAPAGLAEALQWALAETPRDLVVAVTRRHPALWARAVALSRLAGTSPAALLYRAIEIGLAGLEGNG